MTNGETNLNTLLKSMNPKLNPGEYVFCSRDSTEGIPLGEIVLFFKEESSITIVVSKQIADKLLLKYSFIASWITLTIHSSLEAVGLTAAFSKALSDNNIGCNVVAAYHHDHIFVPVKDTDRAMRVLSELSKR